MMLVFDKGYAKYTIFFIYILLLSFTLYGDFDIVDDDSEYHADEHFYLLQEAEEDVWQSRLSAQAYLRYTGKSDDYKQVTRFSLQTDEYTLRTLFETNTIRKERKQSIGFSWQYSANPQSTLVIGQYQIDSGYGLLLSKGSFISQKPGFNTDFSTNRTTLSANARPYNSNTLMGVAFQKKMTERLNLFVYTSYKGTGAKIEEDKITALLPSEPDPKDIAIHSFTGAIANWTLNNLSISTSLNYSQTDPQFKEYTNPLSAAVSISYRYSQFLIFSETATAQSVIAHISGVKHQVQTFSQILAVRHFDPDYAPYFANYTANAASGQNERGIYYKIAYKYTDFILSTYVDLFENIENHPRYIDKNEGTAWGVKIEKQALFGIQDIAIAASYREKQDKEWRNFTGISKYHSRTREYYKLVWTQTDEGMLNTKLIYDYQTRKYAVNLQDENEEIKASGQAIASNITIKLPNTRLSFVAGIFDTKIPLYLYLYSGRINNSLYTLSGEGQFALAHISYKIRNKWHIETMGNILKKDKTEYTASVMIGWNQ